MVIGNCCPPPSSPGSPPTGDPFASAIQAVIASFMEAVDKIRAKRDETPEEPSGLVTITKTVTTYEFDSEALARTLVKTAGAVFRGFRWDEVPRLPQAHVGMPVCPEGEGIPVEIPSEAAQVFAAAFSNLDGLEGPDGKLKPEFVTATVGVLVNSRPAKEAGLALAANMILALAPEKHREQLMAEVTRLSVQDQIKRHDDMEVRAKRYQESQAAERAKKDPIITQPPADAPSAPEASKPQSPKS